jgi:Cupin-like domain
MATDIPQWHNVDRRLFENEILPAGRPVVFKGAAEHWPVVQRRTDSAAAITDYLSTFNPGTQVEWLASEPRIGGRFFYNDAMNGMNFRRVRGTFADALTLLLKHLADPAPPALALQALSVSQHLPHFDLQHRLDLPPPETQATLWIGNASTVAAHLDFNDNIACVAHGRRRFMLFPPEQLENLYVGPLEFTPQGVPISLVDAHNPDLARYPRFEQAAAAAQVAELDAGDAIVIPYLWWHSVRSLEPFNILINYWWNAVRRPVVAPFHCLLHGVLAIANLPSQQRDLWKRLFDHYVFQVHGDPAAHIARERRGLLGSLTLEQAAQFTAVLAHLLGGTHH